MTQDEDESTPLELPECPVCLQQYGAVSTIPRVLGCGHSACEDCLAQLQNPYPCTVRCPSCTQLVKLPNPISSLPKNIDLLRFSIQNPDIPQHPHRAAPQHHDKDPILFTPPLWSHEFYSIWKTWVLPVDTIAIESNDGVSTTLCYGKILKGSHIFPTMGCVLEENQKVSLLEIGYFYDFDKVYSRFEYSYEVKIMSVLYRLSKGEWNELELIVKLSLGLHMLCKVYGFWYSTANRCVYMVSETFDWSLMSILRNKSAEEKVSDATGTMIVSLDICQALNVLHLRGLLLGCLGLSCFGLDEIGRVYVDISEVLATGRRIRQMVSEIVAVGKNGTRNEEMMVKLENNFSVNCVFVSPEVLFDMLKLDRSVVETDISRHPIGYGADTWSLACVILSLLVGKPFAEEMENYFSYLVTTKRDEKGVDYVRWYTEWRQKIINIIECRMGSEFINVKEILFKCLDYNPANRPLVSEVRKILRVLVIKSELGEVINLKQEIREENMCNCLILGDLCQSIGNNSNQSMRCIDDTSAVENANQEEVDGVGKFGAAKDVVEGLSCGQLNCIDLKGHLNCITALAIGGGFLFSSSFDKMVNAWSLQDYSHVHSFKGHEQRVMAVGFVDYGEPLCISGDNGGAICIWRASTPFSSEPLKKIQEQQDWRYSGIHALAVSGSQYLYTGSGDKSIKAWSLQDYSLSCTMNGHKSVVSSLAICDEVLYSGSWDGTVRLWCLNDHSPLAVLGEAAPGSVSSVFCVSVDDRVLVAAHENGLTKIWVDDTLVKSAQEHSGAIFAACTEEKWIFTGGWDKTIKVKGLSRDDAQVDAISLGSITCDSVVTALLYWQGKLFVGQGDSNIKVYYSAVK